MKCFSIHLTSPFFLIIILLTSCKKDISEGRFTPFTPAPCVDSVSFQQEVIPQIINVSCAVSNCHNSAGAGGIVYSNHSEIAANTHPMYLALTHDETTSSIHLSQPILPDSLLQKFYCWIQQGRRNN